MKIEVQCCEGEELARGQCLTDQCPTFRSAEDRVDRSWPRQATGFGNAYGEPTRAHYLREVRAEIEAAKPEGIEKKGGNLIARLSGEPKVFDTEVGRIAVKFEETIEKGQVLKWVILEGEAMKPKRRRRRGRQTADGIRRVDITAGRGSQQISTNKHINVVMKSWPTGA